MDLYVVRHGVAHDRDAERWPDDSQRPLTPEGERRFRRVAKQLSKVTPAADVVLSSPYPRAWQTAEILAEKAGWPEPKRCEELAVEYPPHDVAGVLEGYAEVGSVAVVGHRPCLHELVSYLLTGDTEAWWVKIKKGGVVCLRFDDGSVPGPAAATLRWLLTPKLLGARD